MKIFKFPNRTYKNNKGEYVKKLYPFDKRYTLLKRIIMKKSKYFHICIYNPCLHLTILQGFILTLDLLIT